MVFWFVAMPFFSVFDVPVINGTWVPPLWFGLICLPLGVLVFFVALHVLNAWSWVCARWAEVMFRGPAPRRSRRRRPRRPLRRRQRPCRRSRRSPRRRRPSSATPAPRAGAPRPRAGGRPSDDETTS